MSGYYNTAEPTPAPTRFCPRCNGAGYNRSPNYFGGVATCLLCRGSGRVVKIGEDQYRPATSSEAP